MEEGEDCAGVPTSGQTFCAASSEDETPYPLNTEDAIARRFKLTDGGHSLTSSYMKTIMYTRDRSCANWVASFRYL